MGEKKGNPAVKEAVRKNESEFQEIACRQISCLSSCPNGFFYRSFLFCTPHVLQWIWQITVWEWHALYFYHCNINQL